MEEAEEDTEVAMVVMVVDMVAMGMAKRREKLMLNQKLTPQLNQMPTMVMVAAMEVTVVAMEGTDMAENGDLLILDMDTAAMVDMATEDTVTDTVAMDTMDSMHINCTKA